MKPSEQQKEDLDLDPDVVRADAERYRAIYGEDGISVFATCDATVDELAQQAPLVRFRILTIVREHRSWQNPYELGGDPMDALDLIADLNVQDDDGLGRSTLVDAVTPERVRPGAMLLAGNSQAQAVVRVVAVDHDGRVHFAILPGSVAKNRHLPDRTGV